MNWYRRYNTQIKGSYSPQYIASGELDNTRYLLLEDLDTKAFKAHDQIAWEQVKQCLSWLAHFHSKYLNKAPTDLWDIGTYWHLDTRAEELAVMDDNELKKCRAHD